MKQGFTIEKVVRRRQTSQKSGTALAAPDFVIDCAMVVDL